MVEPILDRDPNNQIAMFVDKDGYAVQPKLDANGALPVSGTFTANPTTDTTKAKAIGTYTDAQTDVELIAAKGAGKTIVIDSYVVSNGATAGNIFIEEDTASAKTALTNKLYLGVNSGAVVKAEPIKGTANKNVGITSTSMTTHTIEVFYHVEG